MPKYNVNGDLEYSVEEKRELLDRVQKLGAFDAVDQRIKDMFKDLAAAGMLYNSDTKVNEIDFEDNEDVFTNLTEFSRIKIETPEGNDFYTFDGISYGETIDWDRRARDVKSVELRKTTERQDIFDKLMQPRTVDDDEFGALLSSAAHFDMIYDKSGNHVTLPMDYNKIEFDELLLRNPGSRKAEYYGMSKDEEGSVHVRPNPVSTEEIDRLFVGEPPKKPNFFLRLFDGFARHVLRMKDGIEACRQYERDLDTYKKKAMHTHLQMDIDDVNLSREQIENMTKSGKGELNDVLFQQAAIQAQQEGISPMMALQNALSSGMINIEDINNDLGEFIEEDEEREINAQIEKNKAARRREKQEPDLEAKRKRLKELFEDDEDEPEVEEEAPVLFGDAPKNKSTDPEQRDSQAKEGRQRLIDNMAKDVIDKIRKTMNDESAENFLNDLEKVMKKDNEQAETMRNTFGRLPKEFLDSIHADYKANANKKDFDLEKKMGDYLKNPQTREKVKIASELSNNEVKQKEVSIK